MFQIPKEQALKLQELHSSARFKHRTTAQGDVTLCVLSDNHMKKDWCVGEAFGTGDDAEMEALADALRKAVPGERPLTPAEMASQLRQYQERFGSLDKTLQVTPEPVRMASTPPAEDTDTDTDTDNSDGDEGQSLPPDNRRTRK